MEKENNSLENLNKLQVLLRTKLSSGSGSDILYYYKLIFESIWKTPHSKTFCSRQINKTRNVTYTTVQESDFDVPLQTYLKSKSISNTNFYLED